MAQNAELELEPMRSAGQIAMEKAKARAAARGRSKSPAPRMRRTASVGEMDFESALASVSRAIDRLEARFRDADDAQALQAVLAELVRDDARGTVRGALDTVSTAHELGRRSNAPALRASRKALSERATWLERELEDAIDYFETEEDAAPAAAALLPSHFAGSSPEQQQKIALAIAEKDAASAKAEERRLLADARAYEITKINEAIGKNPNYVKLQALEALQAISKDPAAKVYFINGDSPQPLPLMHLGDNIK